MVIRISKEVYDLLDELGKTSDTFDSVLRELIKKAGMEDRLKKLGASGKDLISKGGRIPHNTELRMHYKGMEYKAEVRDGYIHLNGKRYKSPSGAARAITGCSIDGWYYWEYHDPENDKWKSISSFRSV